MISKHISYKEGVNSITAIRKGIDNEPNEEQLANMKLVAEKVFEPLRVFINGPIKVNSFFRSPDLNKAIGGSTKSQHCKGQATNAEMYWWIKENLDFDQMIWEFGNNDNPDWVHVSYVSPDKNRNRCLKAYRENSKTKYMVI